MLHQVFNLFERILSTLFPPQLPDPIRDWSDRADPDFIDQSWAGNVKSRRYRDGIDRHFSENPPRIRLYSCEHQAQLRNAEKEMFKIEQELIARGYVNTIHDCWEKIEKS